jgi:hypothetical protein
LSLPSSSSLLFRFQLEGKRNLRKKFPNENPEFNVLFVVGVFEPVDDAGVVLLGVVLDGLKHGITVAPQSHSY